MLKFLLIFISFILLSCEPAITPDIKDGDCVLGEGNAIWKYKGQLAGKHRFVGWKEEDGEAFREVDDLSTFKQVECPRG